MSTTVRIRAEDKVRLDRLQARYLLKTGKRIPLDAVLRRMIEVAVRHEDEFLKEDTPPNLTRPQKKKIMSLPYDFGMDTSPETIDQELYESEQG